MKLKDSNLMTVALGVKEGRWREICKACEKGVKENKSLVEIMEMANPKGKSEELAFMYLVGTQKGEEKVETKGRLKETTGILGKILGEEDEMSVDEKKIRGKIIHEILDTITGGDPEILLHALKS